MPTTVLTHRQVTWTNILKPPAIDIQALGDRYANFHPLNLHDCLTELEYPKIDHRDNYLFLVVQMPVWDEQEQVSRPSEVDIFIAHGVLVTSHRGELPGLTSMLQAAEEDPQKREEWMGRGASPLLYHILNCLVDDCFPQVNKVQVNLRHIEDSMFQTNTQHLLQEIAILRREIIVLRSIFKSQLDIVQALIKGNWDFIQEHLDPYWSDISDHLAQLCSRMDVYAEVIDGLSDTLDTLASHRIDEVVRLLTVTTVLTLPVTLLATIFGMNVTMPYAEHPLLFFAIIVIGILVTVWLVWYLRNKRWL